MRGKKFVILFLALTIVLGTSSALARPEDWNGKILDDFSVTTVDGGVFTLSESLRTHDLVLINLWATWCGPCQMEFPAMEAAWEQYADRVDVVALSIEPEDTPKVLKSFANQFGLRFSVGRDEAGLFDMMQGNAIPTTLIVNKDRQIVAVEIGAKGSAEDFTTLFDALLPEPEPFFSFVLYFRDPAGNPIPGVVVGFCNGEYIPVETDADGCVRFDGDLNSYHVHLLSVPDGYERPWSEMYVYGDSYELTVTLRPI